MGGVGNLQSLSKLGGVGTYNHHQTLGVGWSSSTILDFTCLSERRQTRGQRELHKHHKWEKIQTACKHVQASSSLWNYSCQCLPWPCVQSFLKRVCQTCTSSRLNPAQMFTLWPAIYLSLFSHQNGPTAARLFSGFCLLLFGSNSLQQSKRLAKKIWPSKTCSRAKKSTRPTRSGNWSRLIGIQQGSEGGMQNHLPRILLA